MELSSNLVAVNGGTRTMFGSIQRVGKTVTLAFCIGEDQDLFKRKVSCHSNSKTDLLALLGSGVEKCVELVGFFLFLDDFDNLSDVGICRQALVSNVNLHLLLVRFIFRVEFT